MNCHLRAVLPLVAVMPVECVVWPGQIDRYGYGRITPSRPGATRKAHRVVYERLIGHIPTGMQIDHLCRNRACVNPAHLEPVTHHENALRGAAARSGVNPLTHCPNGHLRTPENTYDDGTHVGRCRQCNAIAQARCKARLRARRLEVSR